MESFDYIIVGAGSAGSIMAARLSEQPGNRVLLIEAGPSDRSPYLHVPRGFGKVLFDPDLTWRFPVELGPGANKPEVWLRGKTLGGSSAVNGMMYLRGLPADYDHWEAEGNRGWGWNSMREAFCAIEDHELGGTVFRGQGGPLHISLHHERNAVDEAVIAAGHALGLPVKEDINAAPHDAAIGYLPRTIRKGRRMSSARAFLAPARRRTNLKIVTRLRVDRILWEGRRAVGVECMRPDGTRISYRAQETILCAGGVMSPVLLQRSGVGPAAELAGHGLPVVHDLPGVGGNMREHRLLMMQFRLRSKDSYNGLFSGMGLLRSIAQYGLGRSGVLAAGSYEVGAFFRARQDSVIPDAQLLMAPYSVDYAANKPLTFEKQAGMQCFGYAMRPESQGTIRLRSAAPDDMPVIQPNYLSADYDRQVSIGIVHFIRDLVKQVPLAPLVVEETVPGPAMASDEDIVSAFRFRGGSAYHAVGTCKMGHDPLAVVDDRLRVHGVSGLRVMDTSVMPTMVSGNTNGPVMAMAWRAAGLILEDQAQATLVGN